ncbi:MAG TPA: hypothetical protein VLJ17_08980 [Xanthobacteraceae bacterium]|nr:hypothetical protein [Xanthobacteraceae bacterium]
MTSDEIKVALKRMDELRAYGVRLLLDNGTTVLAHEWHDDDIKDGLLRVMVRGRHAMIAISRIVLIEAVPPP